MGNAIGDKGAEAISAALSHGTQTSLEKVDLRENRIGEEAARAICAAAPTLNVDLGNQGTWDHPPFNEKIEYLLALRSADIQLDWNQLASGLVKLKRHTLAKLQRASNTLHGMQEVPLASYEEIAR